jgi:hypothetical protein
MKAKLKVIIVFTGNHIALNILLSFSNNFIFKEIKAAFQLFDRQVYILILNP